MKNAKLLIITLIATLIVWVQQVHPLQENTHDAINQYIAKSKIDTFSLNEYLINNLGFKDGVEEPLFGYSEKYREDIRQPVPKWFGEGGVQEDRPGSIADYISLKPTRSVRHFHNPLKSPWDNAGLNDSIRIPSLLPPYFKDLNFTGQSSILWAQNPNQDPGDKWSWQDARRYYYEALTGRDTDGNVIAEKKEDREPYFAKTFRAVGQLMHLVHDASVPEHVRNDIHILPAYEAKVEEFRTNTTKYPLLWDSFLANPIGFDSSILDIVSTVSSAPVPISRIIDTDLYKGDNPDLTKTKTGPGQPVGIAEYTNANFFSPDAMFTDGLDPEDRHYFPYPRRDSGIRWKDNTNKRNYLGKAGEGDAVDHLALASWFYIYRKRDFPLYNKYLPVGLDGKCYEEYASRLIPRAVGYSAGLLNYFFRGKLGVEQTGATPNGEVEITITNLSEDPLVDGVFELYYDNEEGKRVKLELSATEVKGLQKDAPFKTSFRRPPNFETGKKDKYMLVYSGKMGLEEKAYIGKYGVISRDFLVFYKKDGVVKINLMDLRGIDSINASPLDPKVASELGFSINDSKPFSTMQRPFTHQGKTIHLFGSAIRLQNDSYISSGGVSDSYNTQHFYVYDPQNAQYFYLSDTYDLYYNYPPVFNVGSDKIYISKGEYWGVDIFSYADGVVMPYGNKIPSYPDYYRTFYVDGNGWAYFREPDETRIVSGEVGVVNAPLIRSLNGIRIVVKEAKEGQEYGINLYMFMYSSFPYDNTYYDELYYGQGAPLGDISYTAVKGDTVETIASQLAVRVNIATTWHPGWIRWPAATDGNSIIIREDDASVGLGAHIGIGTSSLRGPMILLDYYPYAFDSKYVSPTTIKRNNLVSDVSETVFVELLSNSPSWVPWKLNVYNSEQLLSLLGRGTPSPWETWHEWELNHSGSLTIRKKNEIFKSTVGSLDLEFVDGDFFCNVDQHARYKDVDLTQPGNPEEHQIDATVDEVVGCTYKIGPYINSSRSLTHHTVISQHRKSGGVYGENMGDLLEKWNVDNNSGDSKFINFPMTVGSNLFYEIEKRGYAIDATGRLLTAGDRNFLIDRGNPPLFLEGETKLVTPYETISLPIGRNFSYGWCHVEDADRGVLIQGLQLTERSEVLPGFWDNIYFPILYSNGVRIEEVLAAKLGCTPTDILGIIYYPGVNSDPGRSIWF